MLIVATSTSKILINRKANQLPACVNVSYIPWKQQIEIIQGSHGFNSVLS
jgi:hypothetical protein